MPGGLLQLVAYGVQDFILTGDPQITFFKKAYRRNTLFSSEILKLKFSGDQEFDKTSVCKIPNNGDLLGKSVLQIDLPKISCYQIKEDSNIINIDNTCQENQISKKIQLLNKFLDKKLDEKESHLLTYIKDNSDIKKIIYDLDNYLIKYNLNFTEDDIEYLINNDTDVNDILQNIKKLEEKDIGNIVIKKKYYNSLLNNLYFTLIKLSTVDTTSLEYFRFLDNKLKTFYNKHILNSYDISTQINRRLEKKILINWYKDTIQEINSSSLAEDLIESEYDLNFTNNNKISNHINDYNTIINDNIIPTQFKSDLELSYSYGKEIYKNTINQNNKISILLQDSLNINYLVIKSLINILYNPDAKLVLHFKYSYNSSNSIDKVGDQSLIYSDDTKWTKYYEKLFNLYDDENNKILITDYNLPIKNLLESKFTQFRSDMDNIIKSITVLSSDNANEFFKFMQFISDRIEATDGSARFNDTNYTGGYNFSNTADLNTLSAIHFNPATITENWVDTFSNNLIFIDFNSFIYLQIKNKDNDPLNYINSTSQSELEYIHDNIYNYLENIVKVSDLNDLADIKSNSNNVFTFLCSVIDFNKLFTAEIIIDTYLKNICSYIYTFNIDTNLIGQKDDSKHILTIIKKYTIDSSWYNVIYQNNDTKIRIKDLFQNRSFYPDISTSYKLMINNKEYTIKIFKGNFPFEGTDLLELTIEGTITNIQSLKLISEKNNIIIFSNNKYFSSLSLTSDNKLQISRIDDILIKDNEINDIEIEISLDSNLVTAELISKSDSIFYNRDVISKYLNLTFNQTYVNLFDEKIYPLLKVKILELAQTYKYYQLVSINQKVLDVYKKFFTDFISELSETVGISSFNFYNLLSKKNESLSSDRINKELNNTTELISSANNINGNTNPTNIIERDINNNTNPPLYQYELIEDDIVIVTNNSITYNYKVTNISPTQIVLDQKFDFDRNNVQISKETKYINYGGGYTIGSDRVTVQGIVPVSNLLTNNITGSVSNSDTNSLIMNNTITLPENNSLIQVVPFVKKTNIQIISISSKSITVSSNPITDFPLNQKVFTKNKELIGNVNLTVLSNGVYIINLKKNIDLTTLNTGDFLYQGVTSLRKVSQTDNATNKITLEENYLTKIENINQISNIIPSNVGGNNIYLNSIFRNLIGVNLDTSNYSNFLTDITLGTTTKINFQPVNITEIPDYSFDLDDDDKVVIYGTNDILRFINSGLTFSLDYSVGVTSITLGQNSTLLNNSKIYNSNKELLGIIRNNNIGNPIITLDENGLLKSVSQNENIYITENINGEYYINKNDANQDIELKSELGVDIDTSGSDWVKDFDAKSGKIYKVSNKNRLIESIDDLAYYNLKFWSNVGTTTNTATVNVYIDGRKPILTNIKVSIGFTSSTLNETEISLSLDANADINIFTINCHIYDLNGNFIGKILKIDSANNKITIDKVTSESTIALDTYLYVLNDLMKSGFKTSTAVTASTGNVTFNLNANGISVFNRYIYKKDNSLVGKVRSVQETSPFTIILEKAKVGLAQDEDLYISNSINTNLKISNNVTTSNTSTNITLDGNGTSLLNKYVYKDENLLIGKVTAATSVAPFTITVDQVFTALSIDDIIWTSDMLDLLNIQLSGNTKIKTDNDTLIGQMTSQNNKLSFISIDNNIIADQELYFSTTYQGTNFNKQIRIKSQKNHNLSDADDILIYNNAFDSLKLNNSKYKVFSSKNNYFNIIELNITTTGLSSSTKNKIFNVFGTEIGECVVSNNKLVFSDGTLTNLYYGTEIFLKSSTTSKLERLNLVILGDYLRGTQNNIDIGLIKNISLDTEITNTKNGKIIKIDPSKTLEKTANLSKSNNNIKFTVTGNHNLSVGDMIITYGINQPTSEPNTYYEKLFKKKVIVNKILDPSNFEINESSDNIDDTDNTINVTYYKLPFIEYDLVSIIQNSNNLYDLTLDTSHNLLDGDQILIYDSNAPNINDLWTVKILSTDKKKINLIHSENFNYNQNKTFPISGTQTYSGIIVKISTSSITGVNFKKYVKYSDIIRIDNTDYDSNDSYLNKFSQIYYRSIKRIEDNVIELDEPLIIPFRKYNIDLIKYEIPNFTLDLNVNSLIRCKIGNVYENRKIKEITNDFTLVVDSEFSSQITYYIDLNQVIFENTNIQSQIFNFDFNKIFSFNSKTFNGKEFFEKLPDNSETSTSLLLSYNNWEKFRYYSVIQDVNNNPNNYDIYLYANKLIELNKLHWEYYKENYKILKIKAFTPNVFNYTKSISELILFINKIIYDYQDKKYITDLELDVSTSKNYNIEYFIDDKTNATQVENVNNTLKLQTLKNINEYDQQTLKWNKKHEIKFTDFINQKFKLTDSYVKRFNKKNRLLTSEISMDQYPNNTYQFNFIEGFTSGNKNLQTVEKINNNKYNINSKSSKVSYNNLNYDLKSNDIIDRTFNKNLYLNGTNKIILSKSNRKIISLVQNTYNKKLLDKLYLNQPLKNTKLDYSISFNKKYDIIITRVDEKMLYFSNFTNDLDMTQIVKSGDYIRFKIEDNLFIKKILRIVNATQIELTESLILSKYFVDEIPVKVDNINGYEINTSTDIVVDGVDPRRYFNGGDNVFDQDGNLIGVIKNINGIVTETINDITLTKIVLNQNNFVKVDNNINLQFQTLKTSSIEVFYYQNINSIESELINLSGFGNFTSGSKIITGTNTQFTSEISLGDKIIFNGYDKEISLLKIERINDKQYSININQNLDLNKSYILEEKDNLTSINKIKSIQKYGINNYYLFFDSNLIVTNINNKFSIYCSEEGFQERFVTNITNDTSLTIDKEPKIFKFLDKPIFQFKKYDRSKSKTLDSNNITTLSTDHFVYTNSKDIFSVGNLLKISLTINSKNQIYQRIVKSINTATNQIYFNESLSYTGTITAKSIDLIEYYAYQVNLEKNYPEDILQSFDCNIEVTNGSFIIESSNNSLFKNRFKIGDKIVLKGETQEYERVIVNIDYDSNKTKEQILVDKSIPENINKSNVLFKVQDIILETPFDYQLNKESKSFLLSGSVTITNFKNVVGTNTNFSSEIKVGDYIYVNFNNIYESRLVSKITSDTNLEVSQEFNFLGNNLIIGKYQVLPPSELTGKINVNNTNVIEGLNSKFLSELKVDDNILIKIDKNIIVRKIIYIFSDNLIELDSKIDSYQSNLIIYKINKLNGYQLENINTDLSNHKLDMKVTLINNNLVTLNSDQDLTKILSYGDSIVNSNGLLVGMIRSVTIDKIEFDSVQNLLVNDYLYLPNMISIENNNLRIGSSLKFNDDKIINVSKNISIYKKINSGLVTLNNSTTANNITTIELKVNYPKFLIKKGSVLLNNINELIGVVSNIDVVNNKVELKLNSNYSNNQIPINTEIFVGNKTNYIILDKPLIEKSKLTVNTITNATTLTFNNSDDNITVNTIIFNSEGLVQGKISNINGDIITLTNNLSTLSISSGDYLYYQVSSKDIKSIQEIPNCIINSDVSIVSNSEIVTFNNINFKPNLDVNDIILINNDLMCKIVNIQKNKLTLNNQINLTTGNYNLKKIDRSLISVVQEKVNNGFEFKFFDPNYIEISKKTCIGNIIYENILDTSSSSQYYFNSVYPIVELFSDSTGFISTVDSQFDILPLERTERFLNKSSNTSSSSIILNTNFKFVQFELGDLHNLEEFYDYSKKASYSSKLIESKKFNIKNVSFENANILNNWKKILNFKINTIYTEEIKLDLESKISINQTENLVNKLSSIQLKYEIPNIKETNNQITINGNILTLSGNNILNDYKIGTCIFKNGIYIGKVTNVTESSITLDNISNLVTGDNLNVSSFKSADITNKIYRIRSDIFDYDFNPNYSYKLTTFNKFKNQVNQYLISRLEKSENIDEIMFYSSEIISEVSLKDANSIYSSFVNSDINFVFETINSYQIELSNQAVDNINNTLIQEKEYEIKNINQERIGINSEFTFTDNDIFDIINPKYNSYHTLDEIFEIIKIEFNNFYGHRQLYDIFKRLINIKDLILVSNLTYQYNLNPVIKNDSLANYTQYDNYNGIILTKENVINIFEELINTQNFADLIINQDIQFITLKLNKILVKLICQEKFIDLEIYKQDLLINSHIQDIQNVYSSSINNNYIFKFGTILKDSELTSIKDQKIIDQTKLNYKQNLKIKNISTIDKWIRVEIEKPIDNTQGVWSILEIDNNQSYIYHDVKILEKRDDLVYYLEMVNPFIIDTTKIYHLESSIKIDKLEKDWSTDNTFIITLNLKPNFNSQIIILEEFNTSTDYQSNIINQVYYLDNLKIKENLKYFVNLNLDLNKTFRLITTYNLSRKYLLPNQFKIIDNKLKRRINFDISQESKLTSTNCKIDNVNGYILGSTSLILDQVTGLAINDLLFNDKGSYIGKISAINNNTITISTILCNLKNEEILYKEAEYYNDLNLGELFNITQRIDKNVYKKYQEQIEDIQMITQYVNFDDIIYYLRINNIKEKLNQLVKKYIKIPSEKVGSDFLFNLNKYHTHNLINYFYYYFAENCQEIDFSKIFNVKNLIDYDSKNRYLLNLTKYNIEYNNIRNIKLFGYLENSDFTLSNYSITGFDITNFNLTYTNQYHIIFSLESKIIDLERDPYILGINQEEKFYILITLLDGTEIKVIKDIFYIRDDNIKINYNIELNNYQLVTSDSRISLDYKYLKNTKQSDVEILNSNSINNLNVNLPDIIDKKNKINISHIYQQPVKSIKISGYLYKFYFIKNTELAINKSSILTYGSNNIKFLKEINDDNFKIIEIISNTEFVYQAYFLLQEKIFSVKNYQYLIVNNTKYQDKILANFEEDEIDVNYTNYHIIKIDIYFRKVDNIVNSNEIETSSDNDLNLNDKLAEKIQITSVQDLLLAKSFNKTSTENLSQASINNNFITGINTIFQDQLSVDDIIIINNVYIRQVKIINSQTSITINESVPNINIDSIFKINYLSTSVGNVTIENFKVKSSTHNLGTFFYFPVIYLNKIPIKSIESSYIKINGKIKRENYDGFTLTGTNTEFTKDLKVGDKIRIKIRHNHYEYRNIVNINSDTQIVIDYVINTSNQDETSIYKLQKLLGQIKISGDDYNIVEGTNTYFNKELRVSDYIRVEINGFDYIRKIKSIESDIRLTIEGTFNHQVDTLTNYFKETQGYILNLNTYLQEKSKILELVEEKRLFFYSSPISEDYFGLIDLEFDQKLNIDESHTQEFNFSLQSYNTELIKTYPLIYYQISSPTNYLFLVKNITLNSDINWKLYYKNILSGYKVYSINYTNLGNLNEYVYLLKLKVGLDFSNIQSEFSLSLSSTELLPTDNIVKFYHQISKQEIIIIKPNIQNLPLTSNYYLIVKNQFTFKNYQVIDNKVNIVLDDKLIYYSDFDSYKHSYYIMDQNNNSIATILDIVDINEEFNYQLTLPENKTLSDQEYYIVHIRQLEIENFSNYKKDRTLDIEFDREVHFSKKVYGESESQYLSGSNEIDFKSKIYKFDLLKNKLDSSASYNIIKSTFRVNLEGLFLYYFDVEIGVDYIENSLKVGDAILFYNANIEYNPRVVEIELITNTKRRIYIDKINIEAQNVIIYKYSEINMNLLNTNYIIKYGNSNNFDIMNFYDGSGKRLIYFTSKTPLIRQTNILRILDSSDSDKEYYRFVEEINSDGIIIQEEIGKDIISNAKVYHQKSESINFIDQNYMMTSTQITNSNSIVVSNVTLSKNPNSELKVNDIVVIENLYIRKVTEINGLVLSLDITIPNGTYYNISKLYLIEESIGSNLTYTNANKKILTNNTSKIKLDDVLTINSETDVTKNISVDPVDNYPIIRIDKDFDYLNTINTNIRLNNFNVQSLKFYKSDIDGNYIKLIIQNLDNFLINNTTIYKLYKTVTVTPKYKELNGNLPLDISLYKSESFKKHTFLINSINKRKISENFLISYQDNIIEINNKILENLSIYNQEIIRNKKLIKPVVISNNNLELSFIKNLGYYIINYIEIYIGEQKIDKHTGEWMDLFNQLYNNNNSQFDKMLGNIPELINYDKNSKGNYRLYVPLSFWFCKKSGLALPLIAMHNNTVRFEIKLNKLEDCVKYTSNGILKQEGNINLNLLAEYFYLEENERKLFAESKHEYLIERIQSTSPEMITHKFNNIKIDFVDPIKDLIWVIKSQKNLDNKENTIYCDIDKQIKYDYYQKEYLENLEIYNKYKGLNTPEELIPNSFQESYKIFKNLVEITLDNYVRERFLKFHLSINKETINTDWNYNAETNIWTSIDNHNLSLNDVIMFNTNGGGATNYLEDQVYFVIKIESSTEIKLSRKYGGTEFLGTSNSTAAWKADKINAGRKNQNNALNIYKFKVKEKKIINNNYHLFDKGAVKIYNRKITADKDANYYNYLQTMNYKKTPDHGIYVHNFSLYPLEHQPSGSCNFSMTGENRLEFEATDRISVNNPGSLRIYGRSYNILRVMSGFAGLAFYE